MKRDPNAIIIGVLSLNLGQLNDTQKECINKTDGCPTFNDILNHVIKKNLVEIPNEIFLKSKEKERRFPHICHMVNIPLITNQSITKI